ncbi:MAG TPA: hypothetical protein VNM15_09935, partial [Candidatus Binatia bacterium]|nr:hypothetical protein [Candidatus Binatia bacterium]
MKFSRWNFSPSSKPFANRTTRIVKTLVLLALWVPARLFSQEPSPNTGKIEIDLSDLQKEVDRFAARPYSLGGFLELQPTLLGIDRDSAVSRPRFFKNRQGAFFDQYLFRLRLEGSYKKDWFSMFFKSDTRVRNDFDGWDEDTKLFEAYASAKPSENLIFEAGKKNMKWGKGYAWNPVSFVAPPKNPEDAEEALEGTTVGTVDYIRSLDGPLKTLTLTGALVPVYKYVNAKFGERRRTNFASKLYLLLYDTDLDFIVLTGQSRTTRYGFDFSKNLATNWELHGELGVINNLKTTAINAQGQNIRREADAVSYLLGTRYLTEQETTYILEYYRNAQGFTRREIRNFISFVNNSYATFVNTGNDVGLVRAAKLLDGPYGMPNLGRHYLYFRASQKEPFDILYLTPALTSIMNLTDASLTIIPEIAYSPLTNLELRFRTAVLIGKKGTEYG